MFPKNIFNACRQQMLRKVGPMTRRMMLLITAVWLFYTATVQAQVTTAAVPFVTIVPDARAGAMGELGVAIADNVWAGFWNPAGYAFQQGSEVGLTHSNWLPTFGFSDLWIAHLAYKQPVEELDGIVASQLTYLSYGEIAHTSADNVLLGTFNSYELAFAVSYGTKLSPAWGLGTSIRVIHSHLSDFGTEKEQGRGVSTGFCFDVGAMYKPQTWGVPITFGVNIANIGPKMTYIDNAQADPMPMMLRLGVAYNVLESEYNNITITAEASRLLVNRDSTYSDEFYKGFFTTWIYGGNFNEQLRKFDGAIGAEYWYGEPKLVALRMGYFYEDPREGNRKFMTFGAGIRYDMYGLDFSYINSFEQQAPLGETLRFTLSIHWGGEDK